MAQGKMRGATPARSDYEKRPGEPQAHFVKTFTKSGGFVAEDSAEQDMHKT